MLKSAFFYWSSKWRLGCITRNQQGCTSKFHQGMHWWFCWTLSHAISYSPLFHLKKMICSTFSYLSVCMLIASVDRMLDNVSLRLITFFCNSLSCRFLQTIDSYGVHRHMCPSGIAFMRALFWMVYLPFWPRFSYPLVFKFLKCALISEVALCFLGQRKKWALRRAKDHFEEV